MTLLIIRADEQLEGDIDVERVARAVPAAYTLKGMFYTRLMAQLSKGSFATLRDKLVAPPRLDRYLPFADYPQVDYMRLTLAAASDRFRGIALREAVRRVARDDLAAFAASMIGKVVLSVAGDARSTLMRAPDAYARTSVGGPVLARELDANSVRVEFREYHGMPEYQLGQLEGVALHYGLDAETTIQSLGLHVMAFDVRC